MDLFDNIILSYRGNHPEMRENMIDKGDENDMNAIARRVTANAAANPAEIALLIAREAPTLATLNREQLEQIARMVIAQRLTRQLDAAVTLAGVSWAKERETFLGDTKSPHTRRAYAAALDRLEAWTAREGVDPLALTAAAADNFIRALKAEGRAPATTRRDIAAASAFYTFMERYHAAVKNPFRGTRIRPPNENQKEVVVPTAKEYNAIAAALPPIERAIVTALALRGLRAGALPTLEKKGERYHGKSKGKTLKEGETDGVTLPTKAIEAIAAAGLNVKKPFAWTSANAIERRVNYRIGKLYHAGKIRAAFSCHDFRHLFAVTEYRKDRDILRVSRLLNHANIAITQKYLRSIGVDI
jgi:site-specific recombinase XerC